MKRYGMPYKGSKNKIANKLIAQMPPAKYFVDLFGGGGAMSHAALESGKYEYVIYNEIETIIADTFRKAIHGEFANETRWISHEDFFKLRNTDGYVKLCWSFSNNGRSYLYGKEVEPWEKALYYARVFHDTSLLQAMGIDSDGSRQDIKMHKEEYKEKYIVWYSKASKRLDELQDMRNLQRLQSLESLERLQSLQILGKSGKLEIQNKSYEQVVIPDDSVVYCDIPYKGTEEYSKAPFDHAAFYEWANRQRHPIYISELHMSDGFQCIWQSEKQERMSQKWFTKRMEKLFANQYLQEELRLCPSKPIAATTPHSLLRIST